MIGIAAVQTASEYEYRFTEYDYGYDEIRGDALFLLFSVLVLSIAVLVLVLDSIEYSNPANWSPISTKPPRSTIGIAAVSNSHRVRVPFH